MLSVYSCQFKTDELNVCLNESILYLDVDLIFYLNRRV